LFVQDSRGDPRAIWIQAFRQKISGRNGIMSFDENLAGFHIILFMILEGCQLQRLPTVQFCDRQRRSSATERPTGTFGRIRNTITSSRQIQLALRLTF
jgi:hypothetical protein